MEQASPERCSVPEEAQLLRVALVKRALSLCEPTRMRALCEPKPVVPTAEPERLRSPAPLQFLNWRYTQSCEAGRIARGQGTHESVGVPKVDCSRKLRSPSEGRGLRNEVVSS